ncbi:MAG TPA: enoyl-CoA hydratase/isomerase family protein [Xanthobacteraceae bacterium]|nr:enoyl-CoA hydratase/isomerase family protein [Xanthobacteraceae bacterium]
MPSPPHAEAPSPPILTVAEGRATIRLNRPRHHNRIETGDIAVLCEQFARIEKDRRIRVLVLAASGRTFCAGFNLEELAPERYDEAAPRFDRMVDQLEALRVPTIAAIGGSLYGGGTDLALACDFRIGIPGIELMMPASRIGVHYYYGGLRRYVTRLGLGAAKRLFLAAAKIDAEELLRIGFLDALVPAGELAARVDALAARLTAHAPAAVQGMKRALNAIAASTADAAEITRAWRASMRSPDVAEGLAAHVEKREPRFDD